ncbi:FAD/NAD(P)-binding protein [Caballeronia sp. SEWSISQ10-4 2]|uniref:FAD/NAD(P)-binding protein n=1 Tax=Caballeronia sp. SEWSISQ10-4 2 TaxID=2937438 RepID=UPI00264C30D8|nr:FAD/NAD(P)-binding domain-containing protein [Caballeronia sp. SEWSISQ10-4 2]MDN7182852.1 FAD/NAD(P)-binding protein [Caballeronia sp. SEWSISQ10-4 2]
MTLTNVTLVGMGPRGLSVLERILEHARRLPADARLHIDVIDAGECGQGSHPSRQPDHLLINTVASQITMFAPVSVAGGGSNGPSLVEWASASGYRRFGQRYFRVEDGSGAAITEFDHLPRSLLGEYLAWVYDRVVRLLPERITVAHHRTRVLDVEERESRFQVRLENGYTYPTDYVFLVTGHGRRKPTDDDLRNSAFVKQHVARNPKLGFFASPYPVAGLSSISAQASVAVQGFGLTAHDVISELTLGRGGRYMQTQNGLRYEPSGKEPHILLFSRNCLPFAARGVNQKGLTGKHQAQFFTPAAVRALAEATKSARSDPRVDFRVDVLPLIIKEMAYAYRSAALQKTVDPATFEATPGEQQAIEAILWPLKGRSFVSAQAFQRFFDEQFNDDLAHAFKGNLASPVKAATDVLRDTREALRTAVEFGGLTPGSHRFFVEEFNAITNRVAFGPPKQRNVEFLALRAAGVLDLAGGPGASVSGDPQSSQFRIDTPYTEGATQRFADVLIAARLDSYSPLTDDSVLTANLRRRGLIRPYRNGDYHPGGIDIDTQSRPIGRSGRPHPRLWAIGFLVEGAHFYTHALPRPQIASRQTADAERCVLQLFDAIDSRRPAAASPDDTIPAADLQETA